ncbi:glycosyltransferase family 2 protein [Pseudocnuella soli]|uniref:glycosyltransferase family 2 protein n=1 Tax=Pseudocnuella soli TaxID=2502779 RepID=UPI001043BA4A|nr:glycosyltransferase [Pseudocnuella soli]
MLNKASAPTISVIIPCYNHGKYLQQAIDSVNSQAGVHTEIVVVDDGSSDNTKEVAGQNGEVKYIYQTNAGLSAARNTGIKESNGEYLLFLDADDWLLPGALQINLRLMEQHPEAAFVSGGHEKVFAVTGKKDVEDMPVTDNHYMNLLQGNYIGMHATVLYRRSVFNEFLFDETLRACEDYDLYLKIARKYPVLHHTQLIAAYRIHGANMSGNIPFMVRHVEQVLHRQEPVLRSSEERAALKNGFHIWRDYYAGLLLQRIKREKGLRSIRDGAYLFSLQPHRVFSIFKRKN